jgi:hypothetical protein
MPNYTLNIKKITQLSPCIYTLYLLPSSKIFEQNMIKVYIPNSIKIQHTIHDFNHEYEIDMIKEGIYAISMTYNNKYLNYYITQIKLVNLTKIKMIDSKNKSKYKSKQQNMINNILEIIHL